jgi:hypothetical protein
MTLFSPDHSADLIPALIAKAFPTEGKQEFWKRELILRLATVFVMGITGIVVI